MMLPALSLARRELVRFLRQRNRVVGALVTPLLFWAVLGLGLGSSFRSAGSDAGYAEYFFPGTVLMIVLFTAIFSTISIIEDRQQGFLQGVLVSPAGRGQIVLGKVLGGTALAAGQALLILLLSPLVGATFTVGSALLAVLVVVALSFALTSAGVAMAWPLSSTQGFHVLMNLIWMPSLFLSGAMFPLAGVAFVGLRWLMLANPLTYGLAVLRRAMNPGVALVGLPSVGVGLAVTAAFAAVAFGVAYFVAGRPERAEA